MKNIIDLRSDTVTMPTGKMLESISNAQLGDDVFQEDNTVNELQKKASQMMGMEDALLVPSGTMGNLVSILTHCPRGTEIILGDQSHTFYYEAGGISAFGGIHSRQLKNQRDGTIKLSEIKSSIRIDNVHFPKTSAISLENTHNLCNGYPLTQNYIQDVIDISKENKMKVHIDGARIFNAAISQNIDVSNLIKDADSITFCLSKGLSAPVGSIICGSEKFIYYARRNRKALGGGMRQAGIIASAGIVALENMVNRIKEDHINAQVLAEGLEKIDGITINKNDIKTNIIYFNIDEHRSRSKSLLKQTINKTQYPYEIIMNDVSFLEISPNRFRLVTHCGITKDDLGIVISEIKSMIEH